MADTEEVMKKIGFLVNPIAGMGGAVGLKGTDGEEILRKARELGARQISPGRARDFMVRLLALEGQARDLPAFEMLCAAGEMGGTILEELPIFPGRVRFVFDPRHMRQTGSDDTKKLCREFVKEQVDLIIFCGGDGTARDIHSVVGDLIPVLGIPAGVKMHSALFAIDPVAAAALFSLWARDECDLRDAEVMDIDEEAYRRGEMSVKLFGYARTPYERLLIQGMKSVFQSVDDEIAKEDIARYVEELMDEERDTLFILGPGSTTRKIADQIGLQKTLLGVDLVMNRQLVATDVGEKEVLARLENAGKGQGKIIVSVIGNQGFVLGRGNQQISNAVIRMVGEDNILIVATPNKMFETRVLHVDTKDRQLDKALAGYVKVITGYHQMRMTRIEIPG